MSDRDTFPVRFLNIFVDYLLGQICVGDKLWTHWNKAPLKLWQTQLNFAVWCASSACGVSSAHLTLSGPGGSEARMAKLTAANQKPLIL